MLVYDLQKYHPDFSLSVVDQVLEHIRAGMEDNIFKYNQRRISTVKYLGELYMYRIVSTPVIFDTLWSLISFGHGRSHLFGVCSVIQADGLLLKIAQGLPVPGRSSPIDSMDDFFRIRLVCTLLDTCGACFDKGSSRKKLDHFLTVFQVRFFSNVFYFCSPTYHDLGCHIQLYTLCKSPLSMDVEFMISDTLQVSHLPVEFSGYNPSTLITCVSPVIATQLECIQNVV